MITRTFKLCLNAGTGSAPYINVSQYDEGETWLFELYSETGERYIPSTGAIVGVKSDGHGIINTGTVDNEGRVVITETQQMTASAGRAIFELSIDGLTHGTANFIVAVERKPTDDAVMSDSDLSLIQEAIDSAEVIVEVIGDSDPSEVIGEHVDDWLDNHPEATTTVQDGAITAPKLNNSLWDKLLVSEEASGNPASFDDGADDVPVSSLKVALEPIQTGTGDPSPTNIRPIYPANNRNQFPTTADGTYTYAGVTVVANNGVYTVTGTATATSYIELALATSVDLSPATNQFAFLNNVADGNIEFAVYRDSTRVHYWAMSPQNRVTVNWPDTGNEVVNKIRFNFQNGKTYNITISPVLCLATYPTPTAFTPYQGIMVERTGENVPPVSYPISLGREVYGGTVDLATGVLTVEKVAVDLGTFTWTAQSDAQGQYFRTGLTPQGRVSLTENICTCYSVVSSANVGDGNIAMGAIGNVMYVRDTRYSDASAFRTGITGQLFVYLLATPTTVQLTPQEVKTLLGYNNISSTGTVEVIYHADTKLYVDKMTAVDNNIIAPTEEGFTATRNYTVNDLLIVADTLYKVTANIATGSAITPNSNVTQTTLGALIKALS